MDGQTLDYLGHLLRLADEERLSELHVEANGVAIRICRRPAEVALVPAPPQAEPLPAPAAEPRSDLIHIRSPLVGVFYRAASPDDEPYASVGQLVEVGDTIGLVEAMKVFNEITSDVSGRVVEILADNGQLVHAGDPLIALEPAG
jgi:acetyl-CoA carboxylase biotin carboxyl carrier protein